jgi:hypothetical protein
MPETPISIKAQVVAGIRQLIVSTFTAGLILAVLVVGFNGQTQAQRKVQADTLNASLATGCELALPVSSSGRDPDLVRMCFTQYGLVPPVTQNP